MSQGLQDQLLLRGPENQEKSRFVVGLRKCSFPKQIKPFYTFFFPWVGWGTFGCSWRLLAAVPFSRPGGGETSTGVVFSRVLGKQMVMASKWS